MRQSSLPILAGVLFLICLPLTKATGQQTWRRRLAGTTYCIGVNPRNPNTVYTESNGRIFVSRDGGTHWMDASQSPIGELHQILIHPKDTLTMLCAGLGPDLVRSTDGGLSWSNVLPNFGIDGESIDYDLRHPDTMFAGSFDYGTVYRSTNRGLTWEMRGVAGQKLCGLTVRPDTANILFAGTLGGVISKSTDAGVTWRVVKHEVSAEIPKIVVDPVNPLIAYGTGYGGPTQAIGIWKTTNGGENWRRTLSGVSMWAIDIDRTAPATLYAGSFSNPFRAVYKSTDAGSSWLKLDEHLPVISYIWNLKVLPKDTSRVLLAVDSFPDTTAGIYVLSHWIREITGVVVDDATGDAVGTGSATNVATGDVVDLATSNGKITFSYYEGDPVLTPFVHVEAYPYYSRDVQISFLADSQVTIPMTRLRRVAFRGSVKDSAETHHPIRALVKLAGVASTGPFTLLDSTDAFGDFAFDSVYISYPPIVQYQTISVEPDFPYPQVTTSVATVDSGVPQVQFYLDTVDVLIASPLGSGGFSGIFKNALDGLGLTSHIWDAAKRGVAPLSQTSVLRSKTAIYFTGNKITPLPQSERDSLVACVRDGSNLFISGLSFVEQNDTFARDVLGVGFGGNTSVSNCVGVTWDLFDGLALQILGVASRDQLLITSSGPKASLRYGSAAGAIAGVRIDSTVAGRKVVLFGSVSKQSMANWAGKQ